MYVLPVSYCLYPTEEGKSLPMIMFAGKALRTFCEDNILVQSRGQSATFIGLDP